MLFPTSAFLIFFLVVAAAMVALDTKFTAKKAVLVVASYFFTLSGTGGSASCSRSARRSATSPGY